MMCKFFFFKGRRVLWGWGEEGYLPNTPVRGSYKMGSSPLLEGSSGFHWAWMVRKLATTSLTWKH